MKKIIKSLIKKLIKRLKITPDIMAIFMVKGTVFTIKFGFFFEKERRYWVRLMGCMGGRAKKRREGELPGSSLGSDGPHGLAQRQSGRGNSRRRE